MYFESIAEQQFKYLIHYQRQQRNRTCSLPTTVMFCLIITNDSNTAGGLLPTTVIILVGLLPTTAIHPERYYQQQE